MKITRYSKAFRAFSEGFALLAEALEEDTQDLRDSGKKENPEVFEEPAAWQEEEKKAKKPETKKVVSKKVWDEEPPAEKEPGVIELEDLQEMGRRVIKLHGAPALRKVLKSRGLKNLSSAEPEDYPTLYAEMKDLIDE